MASTGFFNQTITLYSKSGYDRYGREEVGTGTDYFARVQKKTKSILLPNGQVKNILLTIYTKPDLTININDRVDFESVKYKVAGIYKTVDAQGNADHLKVDLMKWQET